MDLDLAQVRAFAAVAEHRHFARAGAELSLSQQALSKRIQRLEQIVGEMLLERALTGVRLTEAGQLFFPQARQSLAAADAAIAALRGIHRPVRVDVWGQLHSPLQRVMEMMAVEPDISIQVSTRRSVPLAMRALLRDEVDLAFGRVHDLGHPWPPELSRQLVEFGRAGALVSGRSPLIDRAVLRAADLAGHRIFAPTLGTSPEVALWWRRAAEFLGAELETTGHNLGADQIIADINADPARVTLLPVEMALNLDAGIAVHIPLADPAILFGWSMIWRTDERNRDVRHLIGKLAEMSRARGWASFRPGRDWLPEPDLADLTTA